MFYATCELNPLFYVNYYLMHERSKIDYIIRQLKINYPNKIKRYHSYNNETVSSITFAVIHQIIQVLHATFTLNN